MDSDDKLRKRRALGDALRRLRANRRLSQEDLALEAAVDRSYLGRIERGEAAMSVDKIWQICQALEGQPRGAFHPGHGPGEAFAGQGRPARQR